MPNAEFYKNMYAAMAEGRVEYAQRRSSHQKGSGFFGRVIRGSIFPLIKSIMPYLKDVALDGVGGLVTDLKEGKSMKESAGEQLKRTGSAIMSEIASKIRDRRITQAGSGVRRRKRSALSKIRKPRRTIGVRRQLFPI